MARESTTRRSKILDALVTQLKEIDADTFLARRIERYDKMGVFTES